jgi:hypothetical protein
MTLRFNKKMKRMFTMKVVIYRIARAHLKTGSIFSNHRILKQFKEI